MKNETTPIIAYQRTTDIGQAEKMILDTMKELQLSTRDLLLGLSVLGGDRLMACDEVILAKDGEKTVGACSLSPNGEDGSGQAGLVGRFVLPSYRRQGIGHQLYKLGIERLLERIDMGETNGPIRIDHTTKAAVQGMQKFLRENPQYKSKLEIHDHSHWDILS